MEQFPDGLDLIHESICERAHRNYLERGTVWGDWINLLSVAFKEAQSGILTASCTAVFKGVIYTMSNQLLIFEEISEDVK